MQNFVQIEFFFVFLLKRSVKHFPLILVLLFYWIVCVCVCARTHITTVFDGQWRTTSAETSLYSKRHASYRNRSALPVKSFNLKGDSLPLSHACAHTHILAFKGVVIIQEKQVSSNGPIMLQWLKVIIPVVLLMLHQFMCLEGTWWRWWQYI